MSDQPRIAVTRAELAAARAALDLGAPPGPVVLVPTMGALHAGHERLLRAARTLAGPGSTVTCGVPPGYISAADGAKTSRAPSRAHSATSSSRVRG